MVTSPCADRAQPKVTSLLHPMMLPYTMLPTNRMMYDVKSVVFWIISNKCFFAVYCSCGHCCVVREMMLMWQVSSPVRKNCLHLNELCHAWPRCAQRHTGHMPRNFASGDWTPLGLTLVDYVVVALIYAVLVCLTFLCAAIAVIHRLWSYDLTALYLSLIHIWRCRRLLTCRSRWSPYH